MKTEQKLLVCVSTAMIIMFLGAFIFTAVGIIDISIVDTYETDPWVDYIVSLVMFCVNMFFVFSITLNILDKRLAIPVIICCAVQLMHYLLGSNFPMLISTFIPFLCGLVCSLFFDSKSLRSVRDYVLNYVLLSLFYIPYTLFSGFVKISVFDWKYIDVENCIIAIIYSIDLYVVYYLIWKKVRRSGHGCLEMVVRIYGLFKENLKKGFLKRPDGNTIDTSDMTKRQKRIFIVLVYVYQVMLTLLIFCSARLVNWILHVVIGFPDIMFGEIISIGFSFVVSRLMFGKTIHAKTDFKCALVSVGVILFLCRLSVPIQYSLFANVIISIYGAYYLHRFAVYQSEHNELKSNFDAICEKVDDLTKPKPFNCYTATIDEFTARCMEKGLNEEKILQAIDCLSVKRISDKELAIKYYNDYEKTSSVRQWKRRYRSKLEE